MSAKSTTRMVLGEGEMIGHKHVLQSQRAMTYEELPLSIRISIPDTAVQTHDEHDRMVYEAGNYRSYHQVEFNPMDRTISEIFD